jgi:hypothetical protein
MGPKAAIVSGLVILGLLAVGYGTLSWFFSVLNRYAMPVEAYFIVAGVLTIVFAMVAARMFSDDD